MRSNRGGVIPEKIHGEATWQEYAIDEGGGDWVGGNQLLFAQISQQITHIQAYIRTQKRTRIYTEEELHGIKWPIDRPTNTTSDTATASAKASADAPDDALVDAPA